MNEDPVWVLVVRVLVTMN